ncbi:MAG: phosphatase PAP2 family protein [Clostridia bacterium]|nr:phosphatase PAP2 family protein [Clostridia bacterium]
MNEFEIKILDFIQEHLRFGFLDDLMVLLTRLADDGIVWIVLAIALICFKPSRKMGITLGVALLLGLIVGNLGLKNLFARPRPYTVNPDIVPSMLIDTLKSYSFPSGHTRCCFESAMAMYLCDKRWGKAAFVLGGFIGFSRMYLYMHYPTDVIGGVILGLINGVIAFIIVDKIYKAIDNRKSKLQVN